MRAYRSPLVPSRTVRIALTHAYCWPEVRRGAERIIHELGRALARRGHEVTVFSAAWDAGRSTDGGVTTVRLQRRVEAALDHEAEFGRRLLPHLLAGRFDAVHSHGRRDAVASIRAALAHRRRRTVFTDLGLPLRSWWDQQPTETEAHERVVRDVDVYGCMSHYALDLLARDYGRRGALTPGGVNLEELVPAPARTPAPTVLFSGAVAEPRKGVGLLLAALPLVARAEPGVRLWLSGPGDPGPLLAGASPEARQRTDVLGLGRAEEQASRYGRAWATALPSKNDSFGMALLESLACGTPIVASTHAAVPELVAEGVGGTCDPDDAASLAQACLTAFALAAKGGTAEACRDRARPYDWLSGLAPRYEKELYARP